MRSVLTIGLCMAIALVSCSKKSNNSLSSGSYSFAWNGQTVSMKGVVDTGNNIIFSAAGVMPGTSDTSEVNIEIPNVAGRPTYTLMGSFSDTASNFDNTATFSLINLTSGLAYSDNTTGTPHPFTIDITSNSGGLINATFSGEVYLSGGSGPDSLYVSNGSLSVTY